MPKISYWNIMTRRKPMPTSSDSEESKLGRVFSTFDLTALGVSATLGVGVYVLAGHVAKLEAGPSVILSFAIAAAASFLAGLCYAEFASRVPKSGSAYIFTYVAIGEFVAFIIGWNLLLEYIIGSASIAKGLSLYIDSLIDNAMKNYFQSIAPLPLGEFLSSYFDFFAFGCPLLLGLALAFGLRKSAGMNNIFCILNLGVVVYVVISVLMNANLDYWRIDPSMVPEEHKNATIGAGGFFPFGFSGTIKGAATCFFGFVGFDCIATTGEEVRNPRKAVPRAILFSLIIIFLAYFGVALLTLMWPYYLLDVDAPLPHAFQEIGWETSKWIVTIGGIIGLIASLFGAMFPLPRILYAMSMDGLIFREFGIISERFQTPVIGTLCAAALTSAFAGLFDLAALVNMLSIGVLLAYTVVAISIIVLRFSNPTNALPITNGNANESSNLLRPRYNVTTKGFFMQLFRFNSSIHPNNISMTVVCVLIACYCAVSLALALLISYRIDSIIAGETWAIVSITVLVLILLTFCLLISIQPKQNFNTRIKPFMVPIVPFLPAISVFINIYLMLMLDCYTWIRFGVWMIVGIFVYFPSTWLYNYKPIRKQINIENTNNDLTHDVNINITEKNAESQQESSNALRNSNGSTSVVVNNSQHDENNLEVNDSNSAIVILDTVLESEENFDDDLKISHIEREEIQTKSNEIESFHPLPLPRTSLHKKETDELEVEIIVVNNFENSQDKEEPTKLRLEIINPDEMVNDIRKEIDLILEEAQEKINAENEKSPEIVKDENIFQNKNFLSHLSEVLKTPSKTTQTLHRVKSNERSDSFKRSRSYHTIKDVQDVFKDMSKEEKIFKAKPLLDLTIPGTPVSSKHVGDKNMLKMNAELSTPGTPVNSESIFQKEAEETMESTKIVQDEVPKEELKSNGHIKEENIEQKLKEENTVQKGHEISESKLPNFKLQSATPAVPKIIKSQELPPENKKDFKEKLAKLLSSPPASKILNLRPISKPLKSTEAEQTPEVVPLEKEQNTSEKDENSPLPTPKKTPYVLLTETMARQRKIFDEVLKTIKNKSDEHANDKS